MTTTRLLSFFVLPFSFFLLPSLCPAQADLFVTDYMTNPSPEQKPLAEQPIVYQRPQRVVVTRPDGSAVTHAAPAKVSIERQGGGNVREARLFASLGEYEPFSFTLRAKQAMEQVFIAASELKSDAGIIPAANIVIGSVEGFHGAGRDILMPIGRPWNMSAYSAEFFWCTVQVPEDAKPGLYRGQVTVTSKSQPVGSIAVTLDVLPIKLDPPKLALGYNYSSPKDPAVLAAHLADMRRHGMTTVAPLYNFHLPVHDADTSELGQFIEAYRKAGFEQVLYFGSPMDLQVAALTGYGSETSKRWQQKYIKVMRLLYAETRKHDVPVLFSIGDELTNKGVEGVKIAERLAKFVYEELPEIPITSDMDGYMEVMAMAPYLNVATFNNGWDGIDHHNRGRTLLNKDFIDELRTKTGAIPWFVNADSGRMPFGFFFWRMSKLGVRGKVEWYYCLGNNEKGSVVRTEGATVYPTLDYERSREGIDDLKYVCKLESLVAAAKQQGKAAPQCRAAEALLARIADSITPDWSAYSKGTTHFPPDGFEVTDPDKAALMGGFDAIRRAVADQIAALQEATR